MRSRVLSSGHRNPKQRSSGFSLVELIVAMFLLTLLIGAAVPVARISIRREKERQLHRALWEMRDAIDRYKDAADRGAFVIKLGTEGYPPDLDTMVKGVDVQGKKVRFLRRVPIDPMTGNDDWGLHSIHDAPDSGGWDGTHIFDVYSKATGTGLDGTKYGTW